MISDQAMGLTGRVLSGTPRDTLHFVDLVYDPHGGPRPAVLITDQGSYSDLIFGIVTLLGFDYRPVLADLPDTKLWRIDATADYGYLDRTARGRSDLGKIARHWPDILRVIASIHTREISAHDAIRVLQREGRLNEALFSRCWNRFGFARPENSAIAQQFFFATSASIAPHEQPERAPSAPAGRTTTPTHPSTRTDPYPTHRCPAP